MFVKTTHSLHSDCRDVMALSTRVLCKCQIYFITEIYQNNFFFNFEVENKKNEIKVSVISLCEHIELLN